MDNKSNSNSRINSKSKPMFRGKPKPPRNIDLRKGKSPQSRVLSDVFLFIFSLHVFVFRVKFYGHFH